MLNLLPMPNGILNLAPGQQWTSNSAYDTTPEHSRTNNVVRIDQAFTDKTRASFKLLKDRDDVWSYNNFTPGTGHVDEQRAGHHRVLDDHAGAQAEDRQRDELRVHAQPVGFLCGSGDRGRQGLRLHHAVRLEAGHQRAAGCSRSATIPIRRSSRASGDRRSTSGRTRRASATSGGNRANLAGYMTANGNLPAPAPEHERARILGRRPVDHEGAPQPQGGRLPRIQQEDGARVGRTTSATTTSATTPTTR